MSTLRETVESAFQQAEEGNLGEAAAPAPQPPASSEHEGETPEQREQRARDERGRFAPKDAQGTAAQPVAQPPAKPQGQPAAGGPKQPPRAWKKDYWGHWDKLAANPELAPLQDYIAQREEEFMRGVSTYKSQWDQAQPIYEAIQPFLPELQQHGIQPGQWIQNLGAAHRMLALGTPQQKLQMFAKLATDYGVPLQAFMQGGRVDPQSAHITNMVAQLAQKVGAIESQRQQAQDAALKQEIDAFKQNAPYLEEVKDTMARLLESGMADDLQTAYDKAVRLHDEVWQREQARQAQQTHADRRSQIDRKKAAATSPRSSSPTGAMSQGGAKKGLRDTIAEAMDELAGSV